MQYISLGNETYVKKNRELKPISASERLPVIDVLRGFAILGILLINIQEYSFPYGFDSIFLKLHPGIADKIVYWGSRVVFQSKFSTMLSILLGLGMAIQATRALEKGKSFSPFYARRMFFLLLIGVVHDLVLWSGMILPIFSLTGLFLLIFQKWAIPQHPLQPKTDTSTTKPKRKKYSTKILMTWAIIFSFLPVAITVGQIIWMRAHAPRPNPAKVQAAKEQKTVPKPEEVKKQREERLKIIMQKRQKECDETIDLFRNGSYVDQVSSRVDIMRTQTVSIIIRWGWQTIGVFLLGIWIWRRRVLQDLGRNISFLKRVCWISLMVGLVGTAIPLLIRYVFTLSRNLWITSAYLMWQIVGVTALTLFLMSGIVLLTRRGRLKRWSIPVAAVGRLAFSNYVFQTLVFTTLFYSYGFRLYGKTGPVINLMLVFVFWGIQIPLSVWWIRRYRFGPLEWLWRSLTYGKFQSMRLK